MESFPSCRPVTSPPSPRSTRSTYSIAHVLFARIVHWRFMTKTPQICWVITTNFVVCSLVKCLFHFTFDQTTVSCLLPIKTNIIDNVLLLLLHDEMSNLVWKHFLHCIGPCLQFFGRNPGWSPNIPYGQSSANLHVQSVFYSMPVWLNMPQEFL